MNIAIDLPLVIMLIIAFSISSYMLGNENGKMNAKKVLVSELAYLIKIIKTELELAEETTKDTQKMR